MFLIVRSIVICFFFKRERGWNGAVLYQFQNYKRSLNIRHNHGLETVDLPGNRNDLFWCFLFITFNTMQVLNCVGFVVLGAQRTKIIVFIIILTRTVYKESWKFVLIIDNYKETDICFMFLAFVSFLVHHGLVLRLVYCLLFFVLLDKFHKWFFLDRGIPGEFGYH